MFQPEKPRVRGSTAPEVSDAASNPAAAVDHRSDLFFTAIQTTRMPMLVTDPRQRDNPIVFANRAFYSMTGYSDAEVVGQNCRFLQGPETDRAAVAEIREAIAVVREVTVEILNYRKDGSTFWNALFISPVFTRSGELVYFFASQLDVSRRRDTEAALAQAQKMEALGQLTGGIAHDFNNLLQVMAGNMEILERRVHHPEPNRETLLRSVERTRSAIQKASGVTQQLLAFSRKQQLMGRPINLNALTQGITDMVHQTLGEGIRVRTSFAQPLANCRLDPSQFESALLNVLVNARDAMPTGGTVTISTENVTIVEEDRPQFGGLKSGEYVSISISDTGVGMPKGIIKRVTEPFFTTKGEGKGTGLGLSMVFGFAQQSGGILNIYSELGNGTTVRLYFPATVDLVRPREQLRQPLTHRGGREKVLVVDDRAEVAEVARDMLDSLGYDVRVQTDPQAALDSIGDDVPQLLFTDVIMPGAMNGYLLANEVQRRHPQVRVLVTTGYAGEPRSRIAEDGYQVLSKPYRLHDLAIKVRMALDEGKT